VRITASPLPEPRALAYRDLAFSVWSATLGNVSAVDANNERTNEMATTASRKNTALREAMTKSRLLDALSESTGLQRKDVASVLDQLRMVIERHVRRRAAGTFTLPGLLEVKVVRKLAVFVHPWSPNSTLSAKN